MATKRKKKSATKRATKKAAPTKAAAKTGAKRGRKPDPSSKSGKIRELLSAGGKPMEIAKQLGCAPGLVYSVRAKEQGGAGRKRKAAASAPAKSKVAKVDSLSEVVAAVRESQQQTARMRTALVKIQELLGKALA